MHTKNQISLTRKTLYGIMLLAIFLVAFGVENSSSATVKAQASTDFGFLNTIGLPWKCGEADPRMVTKDWNDHWNNNTAKGAAIDFNFEGNGDDNKDVLAPFSGTITKSEWIDDAYGEGIIIDAGNGWSVLIAHLKTGTLLSKGTAINKGQLIAKSDNSGISSGPHIHLEFLWNGERPDAGWFNTGGNFLFSHPTDDFISSSGLVFYSNNCGEGSTTTLFVDAGWGNLPTYYFGFGNFQVPGWFDNQASSLSMDENQAVVMLFEDVNQQGGWRTYGQDRENLATDFYNNGVAVNDNTSSLRVEYPMCLSGQSLAYSVKSSLNCVADLILYKNANYNSGGEGEGIGYIQQNNPGFYNVPDTFNDQASSIRIPSGWSVNLFEHVDRGGVAVCLNSDENDFADNYFNGGVGLNDKVTSYEVFDNSTCSGSNSGGEEVKLWEMANFQGNVMWHGETGFSNEPNANTFSMEIPTGWSVKTWKGDDRSGEERCWSSSVNNLQDHTWHLAIQSIEAFNSNVCPTPPQSGTWTANYYDGADHWWDNNNTNWFLCSETIGGPYLNKDYYESAPCNGADGETWVGDYKATINFPAGNYVFRVEHDDGLKLWAGGQEIANRSGSGADWMCPARYLSGNTNLWAILREETGSAKIKISWNTDTSVCTPPDQFHKIAPLNGATGQPTTVILSWGPSSRVNSYEYCLDTINNNACDTGWLTTASGLSKTVSDLTLGTTYYWQARAINSAGPTYADDNAWRYFTTGGGTGIACDQITFNGVILFENKYCNRDQNGTSKQFPQPTVLTDVVSDFDNIASSIFVANGWSIKVFENSIGGGGGSWRCINGSMWDLGVDYYTNGNIGLIINDTISSVQVYNNTTCSGLPDPFPPVQKVMPVWKVLLLVYHNIDANYTDSNGNPSHLTHTLPQNEILDGMWSFRQFASIAYDLSNSEAFVQYDIVHITRPINSLSSLGTNGWWVSPSDTRQELDLYAPQGTYDSVFVLWPQSNFATGQQIPSAGWGWGMSASSWSNDATYATVANAPKWMWETVTVGEPWLHEWLHGICPFYENKGYPMPNGNADAGGRLGYVWSPTTGWASFYRDLMRGKVLEDGQLKGITPQAWQTGSITGHSADVIADYFRTNTLGSYNTTGSIIWDATNERIQTDGVSGGDSKMYIPISFEGNFTVVGRVYVPASNVGPYDSISLALQGGGIEYWGNLAYGYNLPFRNNISIMRNDSWGASYPLVLDSNWYTTKMYVDQDAKLIYMKVWMDGNNEPNNWQVTRELDIGWAPSEIGFRHAGDGTTWVDDLYAYGTPNTPTFTLTVTSLNGIVTANPDQATYNEGDIVELTAIPNAGWAFTKWTGGLTGSANPGSVTVHGNTSVTANYKKITTLTLNSIASNDGWVLEKGENSNIGGSLDSISTTFRLGDDNLKRQYRSILSFNTSGLPDNAVITKATLKVRKQSILGGGNPVTMFQGFMVDIKKGFFGTTTLQTTDFQTAANKSYGPFLTALSGGWYSIDLTSGKGYVNKLSTLSGLTQIRLRFKLDDNNNTIANYLSLFSGNAPAASRPQLIIQYYVP